MGRGQVGASVIIGQNDKGRDKVLVGGGLLCEHSRGAPVQPGGAGGGQQKSWKKVQLE